MNSPKSLKIFRVVSVVAFLVSVAWYFHAQAVYHQQIRHMQAQISYMHSHPGMTLPSDLN
jgi:hypothetical protein